MIYSIRKFLWKRRTLRKIADDALHKEAMAVYSEATVDDILTLKKYDESARDMIGMRIFALRVELGEETGSPLAFKEDMELKNDYEKRHRIHELEKETETINIRIKGRFHSIESVKTEAEVLRSQAQELWHRREVFKKRF